MAILALLFTVASFWWLHDRRGTIQAARPGAFAFVGRVRLRLPLTLYNTGARDLVVTDMRFRAIDRGLADLPYLWLATMADLQTSTGRDFQTPFSVPGRGTHELIAEFEGPWCPVPGTERWMQLEAKVHPAGDWTKIGDFDWWAPPEGSSLRQYLAYRNAREQNTT